MLQTVYEIDAGQIVLLKIVITKTSIDIADLNISIGLMAAFITHYYCLICQQHDERRAASLSVF